MDQDLIDLLSAWRGAELATSRVEELLSRLRQDEELLRSFVHEIRMLGMLKAVQTVEPRWLSLQEELGWGTDEGRFDDDHEDEIMRRVGGSGFSRSPWPRPRWTGAAVLTALLLALAIFRWTNWRVETADHPPGLSSTLQSKGVGADDALAIVLKLDEVQWEAMSGPGLNEGAVLSSGRFSIRSGHAVLSFLNGVTLTLEGPADIDLVSIDRVYCRRGKLRARVPESAKGFVVVSAGSAVIDLGTEFALNVEADGKSKVRVFEGEAEAGVIGPKGYPRRIQRIEKSKEFELDPGAGRIAEAVSDVEGFATPPKLMAPGLRLDPTYPSAVLRSKPKSYWRFQALVDGGVPNEVVGERPLVVHGPITVSGGSQGDGCAVFKAGQPEQFLSTVGLWRFDSEPGCAVELWFMADQIRHASLFGLRPTTEDLAQASQHRYVHALLLELTAYERYSLNKPASIRFLRRWPLNDNVGTDLFSDKLYIPWRWHHVVAQTNGASMDLYVDGVKSHSAPVEGGPSNLLCELAVGRLTSEPSAPKGSRSFVGRLDELAVYDRPLTSQEIRLHYELAKPELPAE
ncbi:MAG: iron dicitrate transport regulator FecR [Paludisphaera borealis]|uniref:LamG-like jellyroll fold domain-containing protein n=1 Tax=Paludisphaera borealis TaxID=1387353 RepID=UPI00284A5659|nr:LamG-like jellyroll fold domain-containing protein [Paludisphaera borealis]MDR3620629.1 iron dicitrate transport regulator FecR [Paludisphaera borealis]